MKVDDNLNVMPLHKPESQPRIGRICGPEEEWGLDLKLRLNLHHIVSIYKSVVRDLK